MSQKQPLFKSVIANLVTIVVVLFVGFVIGYKINTVTVSEGVVFNSEPADANLETFWRVWDLLENKYPFEENKPPTDDKIYGAIQGLTGSYNDPHTMFLEPKEAKTFNEDVDGEFSGAGMEVGMREDMLVVIAPLKDSPAEKAGIKAGDAIVAIDEESTVGMHIDEAVQLIRGKKGTDVVLNIARESETDFIDITITRDTIIVPTLDAEIIHDDIFKISLYGFSANAARDFNKAMLDFVDSDATSMIIDVRNNPGGFLAVAIDIISFFVPQDKVVMVEDFGSEREEEEYVSKGFPTLAGKDFDVVVLVDGGSASASEILAGALSENDVATLVGEQTFGKGSVQELIHLPDKSSIKITVARWLTPKGVSIEENGLTPDHIVEYTIDDHENGRDPQLEKAIELLK